MAYFLGIDGGGSKTEAALGDEQRVFARVTGGSCKVQAVGEERARAALQQVVRDACSSAGTAPERLARVVIGISGLSRSDIAALLRSYVGEVTPAAVEVVGDNAIALAAAFDGGPGVLVIAGTGSIAFARGPGGEMARAGGWGPAISDEGSGAWMGRMAVAQAMRAADRGEPSALLDDFMRAWQVSTREDLATLANRQPPPDFAALFPLVLQHSEAGEKVAREIVAQAAAQLALLARDVIARLFRDQPVRVAMAGGVFRSSESLRLIFRKTLQNLCPGATVQPATVEPVLGALAMAQGH